MTHLDTSFLVDLLREGSRGGEGRAHALLDRLPDQELGVSVHAACELYAGAELSLDPVQERERVGALLRALQVVYPSDRFASRYGGLLAELRRRGETVSTMDLLIGTAALVDGSALVTRNARDFERLPGLDVITY